MVKLNKIYTRTGDQGDTGLADGTRRAKFDLRVEAYGTIDEANCALGISLLHTDKEHEDLLNIIRHDLFDLGADLATPTDRQGIESLRITAAQTLRLEQAIDKINANLSPLNSFVLPGGSSASAYLHLTRAIIRRAERSVCSLAAKEKVNPEAIKYLNRLSDLLFVLARSANNNGASDILWKAGYGRL